MEATDLDRMGRRKTLDAFEHGIAGGHHIGHLPVYVQEIEGWIFRRCRCGFTLALTPNGAILWLKMTKPAIEINNFKSLPRALNSDCWAHPGPSHRSMPLLLQAQLRKLRQKRPSLALQKTQSVVNRAKPQWKDRASRMRTARIRPRPHEWSKLRQSSDVRRIFRTMLRRERARGRARVNR